MVAQRFEIEVIPNLPSSLSRLEELANNLWYSWDVPTRSLFERLDKELWIRVGHNPKLFLRSIEQKRLDKATTDSLFLDDYQKVLSAYDAYHNSTEPRSGGEKLEKDDLVAYFCAEYGFHESLPIYSGGLGILAGDHCKNASDFRLPFVGVGLYYPQGYFSQLISAEGHQIVTNNLTDPNHLPLTLVTDKHGEEVRVAVEIAERHVFAKIWKVRVGHISIYLLDTNVPQNNPEDANITMQLYGGDQHTRIKQEILLGIGGVRMLRKLGFAPTVWHMNEGHAAFSILERIREHVASGLSFAQAIEVVATNSVFTTHTAVPAGHDAFPADVFMHYLGAFSHKLGISSDDFLRLGSINHDKSSFNMTTLAVKGSRFLNGVSKIHGLVSSEICRQHWPQIKPEENPMNYVTNGVHVSTFLAEEWAGLFDKSFGAEWRDNLCNIEYWQRVEEIPDQVFWNTKQAVKSRMLRIIRNSLASQHLRNQISEAHLERMLKHIDPDNPNVLTVGFARRFATYKRATLLFRDLNWLRTIVNKVDMPIVFIFAGKAHPADKPGQELLREIHNFSNQSEFVGKVLLVQGYDLGLSRRLLAGVDVWLNTPIYPLEASGTSGMKAAMNASINLSVLDGWWAESYDGNNGWAIKPSPNRNEAGRDHEDARTLYEILQDDVIPLYYDKGKYGLSQGWVKKAKHSMASILPRFNMSRMLSDYLEKQYLPAAKQGKRLRANDYAKTKSLAEWKARIHLAWEGVGIRQLIKPPTPLLYGNPLTIQVAIHLNGLQPQDVTVELLLSKKVYHSEIAFCDQSDGKDFVKLCQSNNVPECSYQFSPEYPLPESAEYLYSLSFPPEWCGGLTYQIRAYPYHEASANSLEIGLMKWA